MVLGIDDLLIAAAVTAIASYATSQIAADNAEGVAKDAAGRQRKNDLDASKVDFYLNRARRFGRDTSGLEALTRRAQIERGYQGAIQSAERNANYMRDQGISNAAVGFLSSAIKSGYSNAASPSANAQQALMDQAADYSQRAQSYDLNPENYASLASGPQQPAITPHTSDPFGGFQLQQGDSPLLGGAGLYAESPYSDDPYATASPFNRSRFRL